MIKRTLVLVILCLILQPKVDAISDNTRLDSAVEALRADDFPRAEALLTEASDDGNPEAMVYLARMGLVGAAEGIAAADAVDLLREAADLDEPRALVDLAQLHLGGDYVLQDFQTASAHLETAMALGSVDAQVELALLIEQGLAAGDDWPDHRELLREAADQGHPLAAGRVGLAMIEDDVGDQPALRSEAIDYLKTAAVAGNIDGFYGLGRLQHSQPGENTDPLITHVLLNIAAAGGHPAAPDFRDQAADRLDTGQLLQAQSMAREMTVDDILAAVN